MQSRRLRLGDVVDDYCPRERRLSNHVIVAMVDDTIKQTRCSTCDFEHPYKDGKLPARRLKPKKDSPPDLYKQVLDNVTEGRRRGRAADVADRLAACCGPTARPTTTTRRPSEARDARASPPVAWPPAEPAPRAGARARRRRPGASHADPRDAAAPGRRRAGRGPFRRSPFARPQRRPSSGASVPSAVAGPSAMASATRAARLQEPAVRRAAGTRPRRGAEAWRRTQPRQPAAACRRRSRRPPQQQHRPAATRAPASRPDPLRSPRIALASAAFTIPQLMMDLSGKKGLVLGVANKRSLAWAIAQKASAAGADLALTFQGRASRGERARARRRRSAASR